MLILPYSEWGYAEYRRIFGSIVAPPKFEMQPALCEAFRTALSGHPVLPVNRATTALCLALEAFKLARPGRRDVIVPAYICPSVIDAVIHSGLRYVPVDIGPDLNIDSASVERALSPSTLAVIAAHMYGAPAAIETLTALCRRKDVFLVDDAAQVLGITIEDKPLGTFGDVGMISFSQSKTIVAGSRNAGGLLVVNNPDLQPSLLKIWQTLPDAQNHLSDLFRFFWLEKWSPWTARPRYLTRKYLPLRARKKQAPRCAAKISNLVAALAMEQLRTLPERLTGRRRVVEQYHRRVSRYPKIAFPQYAPSRYLTRIILATPPQPNMSQIRNNLRRAGIQTRTGYPIYHADAVSAPTTALALQPRLIELPSHSRMSESEIDRVLECLNRTLPE